MTSIRQNPAAYPLPDWRNFGVMLRVLLGVNLLALLTALVQTRGLEGWLDRYVELAAWVEPLLLFMLGVLALARDLLWQLPRNTARSAILVLATGIAVAQYVFWQRIGFVEDSAGNNWRIALLALAASSLILGYFDLRSRALPPTLAETRLAALNARIRPHFLFNSLNAVLSLIRAEPRQAEAALEALADLFRAALRDPKELVALSEEIALGQQYLDLEKLRLGERLRVTWHIEATPLDQAIPPLTLQPLLENAVYHGIEPRPEGGVITIQLTKRGAELMIEIANPASPDNSHQRGNQMAVANIRERLSLYYDLEARLEIDSNPQRYLVRIILPCRS